MTLYKNKYRIEPARLKYFDYGSNVAYFITICTKNRINYFGNIVETDYYPSPKHNNKTDNNLPPQHNNKTHNCASLHATQIGQIAINYWQQIPQHFPFVILDEFVIMPNHIHGIIIINKPPVETDNNPSPQHNYKTDNNPSNIQKTDNYPSLQWQPNKFGSQSQNLASIVRGFKSSVKRFANKNNIQFEWQERYWDRVIRDDDELANIRTYIFNNPQNWINDENYNP